MGNGLELDELDKIRLFSDDGSYDEEDRDSKLTEIEGQAKSFAAEDRERIFSFKCVFYGGEYEICFAYDVNGYGLVGSKLWSSERKRIPLSDYQAARLKRRIMGEFLLFHRGIVPENSSTIKLMIADAPCYDAIFYERNNLTIACSWSEVAAEWETMSDICGYMIKIFDGKKENDFGEFEDDGEDDSME
ncbi:MAG: hypothetical protein MJ025_02960 [Victivallaceae bacterium]|nr:hypothetical protein [Victivallaceae bacterium]